MLQNSISINKRYKKFIEEIVLTEIIWALKSTQGYASSTSNDYQDENGELLDLIPFWSDRKLANVCAKKYWQEYKPVEIKLSHFVENWCVGMYNKNEIIGTNFDWNLFGKEIDPLELIIEIHDELLKKNKSIQLSKYPSVEYFRRKVEEILKE